ncbi:MAG: crossover junction endodeoxyribonuclease RuvC [Candidatus Wildermuthbacteria bacterium]|nr:crossover junction endodeoxyribonuclease RuvC [Candidatus Wildermuthbacteria bacterium]
MIILGIDPGTAITGFGIVRKELRGKLQCVEYGTIETPKSKAASQRLLLLQRALSRVVSRHRPAVAVVERMFFFKNAKTALPVSEARGVILAELAKKRVRIIELTPLEMKAAITGYGRAEKKQMQRMVQKTLRLQDLPRPDDAADALGLAIAGSFLN